MKKKKIGPGDEVRFRVGNYFAEGMVKEVYGHPSHQIALIRIIDRGAEGEDFGEETTVNFPLDVLELLPRKAAAS